MQLYLHFTRRHAAVDNTDIAALPRTTGPADTVLWRCRKLVQVKRNEICEGTARLLEPIPDPVTSVPSWERVSAAQQASGPRSRVLTQPSIMLY